MSKYLNYEEAIAPKKEEKLEDINHMDVEKLVTHVSQEEGTELIMSSTATTAFDPVKRIKDGFNDFKINEFNKYPNYYRQLAEKQEPKFLMFACSDSRVCPTNILNLRPGEAFMARNIANMVPAFNQHRYSGVGAIIEYAILALKVEVIMVIGHSRCGGIGRLISLPDEETSYDFIDNWVRIGEPAKAKVLAEHPNTSDEELQTLVEKESVMNSLVNLLSYPYVRSGVADKKLKLMGGYYDFVCGKFQILQVDYDTKPPINI